MISALVTRSKVRVATATTAPMAIRISPRLKMRLAWSGCQGKGRALGAGLVKFTGQILPDAQRVTYTLDFKRLVKRTLSMVIADGAVAVDGRPIYSADDLKVGVFASTDGF